MTVWNGIAEGAANTKFSGKLLLPVQCKAALICSISGVTWQGLLTFGCIKSLLASVIQASSSLIPTSIACAALHCEAWNKRNCGQAWTAIKLRPFEDDALSAVLSWMQAGCQVQNWQHLTMLQACAVCVWQAGARIMQCKQCNKSMHTITLTVRSLLWRLRLTIKVFV